MERGSPADCGPPDSAFAWHGLHGTAWEEWSSAPGEEDGGWNSGI